MVAKVMVVLRTLFLIFIVGFTVRALPLFSTVPRTLDEQYSRCAGTVDLLQRAVWYAVAWIAFETLVGWVTLARGRRTAAAPPPPGASAAPPRA